VQAPRLHDNCRGRYLFNNVYQTWQQVYLVSAADVDCDEQGHLSGVHYDSSDFLDYRIAGAAPRFWAQGPLTSPREDLSDAGSSKRKRLVSICRSSEIWGNFRMKMSFWYPLPFAFFAVRFHKFINRRKRNYIKAGNQPTTIDRGGGDKWPARHQIREGDDRERSQVKCLTTTPRPSMRLTTTTIPAGLM
jgi:hypothetical protein